MRLFHLLLLPVFLLSGLAFAGSVPTEELRKVIEANRKDLIVIFIHDTENVGDNVEDRYGVDRKPYPEVYDLISKKHKSEGNFYCLNEPEGMDYYTCRLQFSGGNFDSVSTYIFEFSLVKTSRGIKMLKYSVETEHLID